ncbi:MAG: SCP2 sterol-binding domain-containing protein, partial [Rhodobiaceae bacterium]|nr:SCP2 sterol-binding domain-containing protein [Rhodobiaceae bacterium]
GYQSESGPWRNFYLCGAHELRHGLPESSGAIVSAGMAKGLPVDNLLQVMAVRLNGLRAGERDYAFNLNFTDLDTTYLLTLKNGVLYHFAGRSRDNATASLTMTSVDFKLLMMQLEPAADLLTQGRLTFEGDALAFADMASCFDQFNRRFPIVTPRPEVASVR